MTNKTPAPINNEALEALTRIMKHLTEYGEFEDGYQSNVDIVTLRQALQSKPQGVDVESGFASQAYIVIGSIVGSLDAESDEIDAALTYFSEGKYNEDFLPWDCGLDKSE